jgi:outer membrane lipoprotein SlyB
MIEEAGKGSGLGAVAGGVAGGLLGHQVGAGTGKDIATVVGVVGGALAGNKIEQAMKKTKVYDVVINMENGETRTVRLNTEPSVVAGDKVKIENELVVKQ